VEIPAGSVSQVVLYRGQFLILLDHSKHMLLKAPGDWNSYALGAVCQRAGLPRPGMVTRYGSRTGRTNRRSQTRPRYQRAPGYRRLRVRPRGFAAGAVLLACLALALAALIGWGPGVGIVTLVHGFSDQALVTNLRKNGVRVPGLVIGVPRYPTDSDGDTEVTYQPTLNFTAGSQIVATPDPAIGGRRWPVSDAVVTVVYDPARPGRAAVAGQLRGSPWGGAPLGNLISGALLTLALPVLTRGTARRIRDRRRATREGLLEGIW